jgi:polysaccharide biosynthesis/export protein
VANWKVSDVMSSVFRFVVFVGLGLLAGPKLPAHAAEGDRQSGEQARQAGQNATTPPAPRPTPPAALPTGANPTTDFVIGPEDVLQVTFWRERDLSVEQVVVRPDGMISLPLLNDIQASGLTPDQLRANIAKAASKYLADPNVTVVIREIKSRKVFITGQVTRPGPYPITGPTTVLQLIALAGGVSDFADSKNIAVMRTEGNQVKNLKFNYRDVIRGKNLQQNIALKPGDTVVVP